MFLACGCLMLPKSRRTGAADDAHPITVHEAVQIAIADQAIYLGPDWYMDLDIVVSRKNGLIAVSFMKRLSAVRFGVLGDDLRYHREIDELTGEIVRRVAGG